MYVFHFIFSPPYIWNRIKVSQNNFHCSCLAASSYSPVLMIKVEKTLIGTLKINTLGECLGFVYSLEF